MPDDPAIGTRSVPMYCYQCVSGPDLMKVEVKDGVALRVSSNYDIRGEHPGGGRVCVKAYGLVQKTYNPNRIRQPMRRTNPKKGRHEDPGFVPISWDEALGIVGAKLREVRAKGLVDESGFPRVAVSTGGGGTPVQYMGTFPAFMSAWGPIDQGYGAGQGIKCYHSEHLYGELWHRAFIVSPDTPYVNYIINCGNNVEASGGVVGVWREADARVRGAKRVQVEPHLSVTGALSAEWVPIRPKTDAAFLFGLIHHILHGRVWQSVCDVDYLKKRSNSPYLVGPNGWFLRDLTTGKPLVWDASDGAAKPYDAPIGDAALVGAYTVAGYELGPDDERIEHRGGVRVEPSFVKLMDHVRGYTPEWAASECDVPAATIRRIADEYLAHACIGQTIEIEGKTLPFRPVAVMLGKTVNNGWGGYHCCWARTVLAVLVGALEVPGGTLGTTVKLVRPAASRTGSVQPGPDGFMTYQFNATTKAEWAGAPHIRNAFRTLVPLASNSPWSPALGPAHLPWLFAKEQPDHWPRQTPPDVWFCYRTNPAISLWDTLEIANRIAEFPFTVCFAYTDDETNHFADVLLPEATDLESLQLVRIGSTKFFEQFWKHEGWAIRQPAVAPVVDCMDMTDISTRLASESGLLEKYNEAINRGAAGMGLRGKGFDYALDPAVPHTREAIWDAVCRAASHDLSDGTDVRDLERFMQDGYMLAPFAQLDWYLWPALVEKNLRFELPYQERLVRHGRELAHRLHESGIEWWDRQLREYEFMPTYEPFPEVWNEHARASGAKPEDYPFWALTARSMQYSWGANVGLPMIREMAENVAGHRGVVMNRSAARKLGIADGDDIVIESVIAATRGRAVLREGIRPDTLVMIGQFDHWKTPFAKDLGVPSLNTIAPMSLALTDATGSGSDIVKVRVRKATAADAKMTRKVTA